MKKTIDHRMLFLCLAAAVAAAFLLLPSLFHSMQTLSFDTEDVEIWKDGWTLVDGGTPLVLPAKVEAKAGEVVAIRRVLPQVIVPGRSVCIRASSQSVRVLVNGEEVASHGTEAGQTNGRSPGSAWLLFRLPGGAEGGELTIEYSSPYTRLSGSINEVMYGSKGAIMFFLVRHHGLAFFVAFFIFVLAAIMLFANLFTLSANKAVRKNLICLALFALFSSIWMMGESKMMQFFTGNPVIIGAVSYLALLLMPMPFIIYMDTAYERHYKSHINWFFYAFLLNFFVNVIFDITGVADFFSMLPIIQGLTVLLVVGMTVSLLYEAICFKNREARQLLYALIVLIAAVALELIGFIRGNFFAVSSYLGGGILCYTLALGYVSLRRLHISAEAGREAKFYRRLAYVDFVTGGGNRTAFQRDVDELFHDSESPDFWLLTFDMNGLKSINDKYGHLEGDEAIKSAFGAIQGAFAPEGKCYRMGGDEFGCLFRKGDGQEIGRRLAGMQETLEKCSREKPYAIQFACGYAHYDSAIWGNFTDFWNAVDKKMYADKARAYGWGEFGGKQEEGGELT